MTPRVPLVCTPEEFVEAVRLVQAYHGMGQRDVASIPAVAALFRPAEEPEPTPVRCGRCGGTVHEWTNGIGGRGASCTSCGFGWGCATPAAPAAPPPAGEPGPDVEAAERIARALYSDVQAELPTDVDGRLAAARMLDRLVEALAALRAENERLRRELERQPPEGGTER